MSRIKAAGICVVFAAALGAGGAAAFAQPSPDDPCEDPYTAPPTCLTQEPSGGPDVLGAVTGPPEVLPATSPAPAVVAQPTFTG